MRPQMNADETPTCVHRRSSAVSFLILGRAVLSGRARERVEGRRTGMNPQRWHQVEQIYNSVLERNPEERDAYLEKACAGDEALQKEVESLLARNDEAAAFIESPAIEAAAKALAEDSEHKDTLVGRTLLHYSLLERIGAGGMGVVYRAHDNNLNRDVAIKVLPDIFAQDAQRLARFEREARAVAALSHPNILGIFDLCRADGVP